MAIDQAQLIQMLLQGGGGGTTISPTSGLQDPSLSGLQLGPQGMGFGGGASLMGGGPTGFGGGEGGGLDLSQLLAQLQAAPGVTGAGMTTPIGFGGLGGGFGRGFGAGGQLREGPMGAQQGQAGLGGAGTAAQFLSLLKEGVGLGKSLSQLFPKGATSSQVSDINSILAELGIQGTPFVPTASVVSGASGGSVPTLPFDASQTAPFQIDPAILSGLSGGSLVQGGTAGGAALSAQLGAQGLGDIPATGVPIGLLESLGGLPGILGGAGVLGNLGFGALNLSQGNLGRGLGGILGTGAGLGLGAALAPETFGLSLLLGGLGGGSGGLLGSLFGGGGPSEDWQSFGSRIQAGLPRVIGAGTNLLQNILTARSQQELAKAISAAKQEVEGIGVGGFSERAPGPFEFPELPGATGTAHEGGALFNPNALNSLISGAIPQKRAILSGEWPLESITPWSQWVMNAASRAVQGAGGNWEDFGIPSFVLPPRPQPRPPAPIRTEPAPPTGVPALTSGVQGMNIPGSGDADLLTLLQRMGLV